jgi:alanine racemase
VTDVPGIVAGDPVVVLGGQGSGVITGEEVAGWCETIAYEVLTSVGKRVPRVYVEEFDA